MVTTEPAKAEVKRRKRRSKRTIGKHKKAKEARRLEREHRRVIALAEADRRQRQRSQIAYDAQLAHERERVARRLFQEQGVEWLMGYDTPAAQQFERYYQRNLAAARAATRRAKLQGDPLNLTVQAAPLSKKEKKQLERDAEEERLARGEKREFIPDLDSPRQNVMVTTLPHSFRRVKLQIHQEPAAERFVRDWESAGYTGLSSLGFDPRVDSSSKQTQGHLRAAEAQTRLKMAEKEIGERNFDICRGVLILNLNASRIHSLGGRDHRTVNHDIEVALNALAGFYDPVRLERDPTWKAFKRVIEAGLAVIAQGEEETR